MKSGSLYLVFLLLFEAYSTKAQQFLNGDFEKHSGVKGNNYINLSNNDFNSMMEHTFAFGSYGDMDIINTEYYDGPPQSNSWYVAFTGGETDAISMQLNTTLKKGESYTISFYDRAAQGFIAQPFQIGISESRDIFGTIIYTAPLPEKGVWNKRTFTFIAAISAEYVTVRLAGAANIGEWAQADHFAIENSSSKIITGVTDRNAFCGCDSVIVPFMAEGKFEITNNYSVQLSDEKGRFDKFTQIGSLKSNSLQGNIICHLPCEIKFSDKYRIRVVSSNPGLIGSDNGIDLEIYPSVSEYVKIGVEKPEVIHEGSVLKFFPENINSSNIMSYQWLVNDVVFSNERIFTTCILKDGDIVKLKTSFFNNCKSNYQLLTDSVKILMSEGEEPEIYIEEILREIKGKRNKFEFQAIPSNEYNNQEYIWYVNGIAINKNSLNLTLKNLKNGDKVVLIMICSLPNGKVKRIVSNTLTISFEKKCYENKIKKTFGKDQTGVLKYRKGIKGKKSKRFVKLKGLAYRIK